MLKLIKYLIPLILIQCGGGPNIQDSQNVSETKGEKGEVGEKGSDGTNGTNGEQGLPGSNGMDGTDGINGSNGHSIVSVSRLATNLECPGLGGSAVDFYLDVDDSLSVSVNDVLQSGVVACNGSNGLNSMASVSVFNFVNSSACQTIVSGELFANKASSNSNKIRLYNNELECINKSGSGNNTGRINELCEGHDELFYHSDSVLVIIEGSNSGSVPLRLRKIVFN